MTEARQTARAELHAPFLFAGSGNMLAIHPVMRLYAAGAQTERRGTVCLPSMSNRSGSASAFLRNGRRSFWRTA
ncbi:hypothetical protein [Primorskyibacter marinus]|uniref:hypothetical protein n=1 Tax=Primorskyibacter marinus TaxID=1977320 RepID=UPI000E3086EF|nr:hypothetical protein [Primorskyibacter marinus]